MNCVKFERIKDLPNATAVYVVMSNEVCLYVGSTVRLKTRICNHNKKKEFLEKNATDLIWFEVEEIERLAECEVEKIKKYKPILNNLAHRTSKQKGYSNGIHKDVKQVGKTTFRDTTLLLLHNRCNKTTFDEISKVTGLPLPWIKTFSVGKCPDPGVNRVQALYEYLSGKALVL
jgi:predicted GIY-YIG superfamily endonuclease